MERIEYIKYSASPNFGVRWSGWWRLYVEGFIVVEVVYGGRVVYIRSRVISNMVFWALGEY